MHAPTENVEITGGRTWMKKKKALETADKCKVASTSNSRPETRDNFTRNKRSHARRNTTEQPFAFGGGARKGERSAGRFPHDAAEGDTAEKRDRSRNAVPWKSAGTTIDSSHDSPNLVPVRQRLAREVRWA